MLTPNTKPRLAGDFTGQKNEKRSHKKFSYWVYLWVMNLQYNHTQKSPGWRKTSTVRVLLVYSQESPLANVPSPKQNCVRNNFRTLLAAIPDDIAACGAFPGDGASGGGGVGNGGRRERLGSVPLLASLFTSRATPLCLLVHVVSVFVGCVQKLCHVFSRFCFFCLRHFFMQKLVPQYIFCLHLPFPTSPSIFRGEESGWPDVPQNLQLSLQNLCTFLLIPSRFLKLKAISSIRFCTSTSETPSSKFYPLYVQRKQR